MSKTTPLFSLDARPVVPTAEHVNKRSLEECLDTVAFAVAPSSVKRIHSSEEKNRDIVGMMHAPYVVASTIAALCCTGGDESAAALETCCDATRAYLAALAAPRISGNAMLAILKLLLTPTNIAMTSVVQAAIGSIVYPYALDCGVASTAALPPPLDRAVGIFISDTAYSRDSFIVRGIGSEAVYIDVPNWPFTMKRSNTMKHDMVGYWTVATDANVAFVMVYHPLSDEVSILEPLHTGTERVQCSRARVHTLVAAMFPTAFAAV